MLRIEAGEGKIRAAINLPGSKSISNRFLVLREALGAETIAENLSAALDTKILSQALDMVRASGSGAIDIGQAGSDMRFLTAYLAATGGEWVLTGTDRMKERPVGPLVECLRTIGADIEYLEKEGYPPVRIRGRKLSGGEVFINAAVSSQFISALLLITPLLSEPLVVNLEGEIVSRPYINMTLGLLRKFGLQSSMGTRRIEVLQGKRKRKLTVLKIESDWSAASYYYSLCALSKDASIELKRLDKKSLQADALVAEIYRSLGIRTVFRAGSVLLIKDGNTVAEFEYSFNECPDIAQTVAVTCFGLGIKAKLSGLQTLRLKETDRIEALATELRKLGATVQTGPGELLIGPAEKINNASEPVIKTYDDHRMAMSFAPLAVLYDKLLIEDPGVVAKSYPAFWDDLKSLGFSLNLQP